jgi:selenocysteine lyase/cysteine desulfurase
MTLVPRSAFVGGADDRAYLYTAGEGLVPASALDATRRYYEHKTLAGAGRQRHAEVEQACRAGLAQLMGSDAGDIALLGSSSEGINAIYSLIDWRPGDNVVVPTNDLEFPSVVLPAVQREPRGVEVRVVERRGWEIAPEDVAALVDERTRLVFLSHVSYRTGFRHDLEEISRLLGGTDALFAVDATQSLGVVPVPSHACDFLVASSCKWLLGPHGIGVFFWNRRRRPGAVPGGIGWYSVVDDLQFPYELKPGAERFELGGPNLIAIYALLEGVRLLLDTGVERIERHVLDLGARLIDGLRPLELDLMTPIDPARRAGIVSWSDRDFRSTADALERRGVIVTGSSGRIRAAVHLYNDETDVDRLIEAMREMATSGKPVKPAKRA